MRIRVFDFMDMTMKELSRKDLILNAQPTYDLDLIYITRAEQKGTNVKFTKAVQKSLSVNEI